MEMHILAYVYHWGRETLWATPVRERKQWVDLIREQREAEAEELQKNVKK